MDDLELIEEVLPQDLFGKDGTMQQLCLSSDIHRAFIKSDMGKPSLERSVGTEQVYAQGNLPVLKRKAMTWCAVVSF